MTGSAERRTRVVLDASRSSRSLPKKRAPTRSKLWSTEARCRRSTSPGCSAPESLQHCVDTEGLDYDLQALGVELLVALGTPGSEDL
jgi:hypothetical protein